jgi:hypothetical protein
MKYLFLVLLLACATGCDKEPSNAESLEDSMPEVPAEISEKRHDKEDRSETSPSEPTTTEFTTPIEYQSEAENQDLSQLNETDNKTDGSLQSDEISIAQENKLEHTEPNGNSSANKIKKKVHFQDGTKSKTIEKTTSHFRFVSSYVDKFVKLSQLNPDEIVMILPLDNIIASDTTSRRYIIPEFYSTMRYLLELKISIMFLVQSNQRSMIPFYFETIEKLEQTLNAPVRLNLNSHFYKFGVYPGLIARGLGSGLFQVPPSPAFGLSFAQLWRKRKLHLRKPKLFIYVDRNLQRSTEIRNTAISLDIGGMVLTIDPDTQDDSQL